MACNWLMMTSSGEDNWPWEFGSAHRQKKKKNRRQSKKPPSLRLRGLIIILILYIIIIITERNFIVWMLTYPDVNFFSDWHVAVQVNHFWCSVHWGCVPLELNIIQSHEKQQIKLALKLIVWSNTTSPRARGTSIEILV